MYYFIYLSYFTDSYTIIYLYNSIYCKYVGIIIVLSPYSTARLNLFLKCEFSCFDL